MTNRQELEKDEQEKIKPLSLLAPFFYFAISIILVGLNLSGWCGEDGTGATNNKLKAENLDIKNHDYQYGVNSTH